MQPNDDANGPDDPQDDSSDDNGVQFSDLPPQAQNELLKFVMQGKPQTPANMNQARNLLTNDPDTVAQLCDKLGIETGDSDDQQSGDEDGQR